MQETIELILGPNTDAVCGFRPYLKTESPNTTAICGAERNPRCRRLSAVLPGTARRWREDTKDALWSAAGAEETAVVRGHASDDEIEGTGTHCDVG